MLGLILGAGLALRLWGIGFASSTPVGRPDEELFAVEALAMFTRPVDWLARGWPDGFFMVWHAVLRLERGFFHLRHRAGGTSLACLLAVRPLAVLLPMRVLSALFGTITAWVVGRLTAAMAPERGAPAALWATAIYAVNYQVARDGHFGVSDAAVCLEIALTLLACVKAISRGRWWLVGAGFCAGLAFSTKYSAAGLVVPAAVAGAWVLVRHRGRAAGPIASALVAAVIGVLVFSPHLLTHWHDFREGLGLHAQRYAPGGKQTPPLGLVTYPAVIFPAAFGWPGFILCLAGLVLCVRRRECSPLTFYLLVFYVAVLGPLSRVLVRYGSPLVPALAAVGGVAAAALVDRLSEKAPRAMSVSVIALLALASPAMHLVAFDRLLARSDTRDLARGWLVDRGTDKVVLTEGAFAHVQAIDATLSAVCRRDLPDDLWRPTPILPAPAGPLPDDSINPASPVMAGWRGARLSRRPVRAGMGEPGWEQIGFLGTDRYLFWEKDQRQGLPELRAHDAPDYLAEARGPRSIGALVGVWPRGPRDPDCWTPAAHFSPGALEAAGWDRYDAFLVPFTGLGAVERPGPEISIYQNTCKRR